MMPNDPTSPLSRRLRARSREIAVALAVTLAALAFLASAFWSGKSNGRPIAAFESPPGKM